MATATTASRPPADPVVQAVVEQESEQASEQPPAELTQSEPAPEPTPTEPMPPEPSVQPPITQPTPNVRPRSEQAGSVEESIRRRFAAAASQVERAEPMPAPEPEPAPVRPIPFELIAVPDLPDPKSRAEQDDDPDTDDIETVDDLSPRPDPEFELDALAVDDELPPLPDIPSFAPFLGLDEDPRVELISPQSEVVDVEASPFRETLSGARPWIDDDQSTATDTRQDPFAEPQHDDRWATDSVEVDEYVAATPVVDDREIAEEEMDDDSPLGRKVAARAGVSGAPEFRRLDQVASTLQILWLVAGTAAVLLTAGLVMLNLRLEDFRRTGDFTPTETLSNTIDSVFTSAVIVSVLVSLAATVWWTLRANANRHAVEGHESRFTSKQIVAGWLVPVVNLAAPALFIHHIWNGSGAKRRLNLWVMVWWVSLITFGIGLLWLGRLPSASVEDSLDANAYAAITYGLLIAACLAAVGMVSSVSTQQAEAFDDRQ